MIRLQTSARVTKNYELCRRRLVPRRMRVALATGINNLCLRNRGRTFQRDREQMAALGWISELVRHAPVQTANFLTHCARLSIRAKKAEGEVDRLADAIIDLSETSRTGEQLLKRLRAMAEDAKRLKAEG